MSYFIHGSSNRHNLGFSLQPRGKAYEEQWKLDEMLVEVLRATNENTPYYNENTAITGMAQLYTE